MNQTLKSFDMREYDLRDFLYNFLDILVDLKKMRQFEQDEELTKQETNE